MKPLITTIILVAALVIGGLIIAPRGNESLPPSQAKLPDLTFLDYDGNSVSLTAFAGKPLVVNSWAAWCPFCKKELLDFAAAQEEFSDQVVIVAIDRAEPLAVAKGLTDELGITDKLIFLLDPNDQFYQAIGGFSMPETIFVNKDGVIVSHKRGPLDLTEIRERIQTIL